MARQCLLFKANRPANCYVPLAGVGRSLPFGTGQPMTAFRFELSPGA